VQPEPHTPQLVVIGASAGGIEALSRLVASLPVPFPAPIVVAQHLDPVRVSQLETILARVSTLPVRTVTDHATLEPGVVHVVPAGVHVEFTDHELRLRPDGEHRPMPSIDRLFASAAPVFGEGMIAVILTGSGTDGADGARAVKSGGGTVVIQNPATASHPSMPLALAPTVVDVVADVGAIGPLLGDLLAGGAPPQPPEAERRLRTLLDQLRSHSGIDFNVYKEPTILRRLRRRMADTGAETLEQYSRYLQRHPEEYQRLASSFLINVTDFFRDPDLFDYLRDVVVPELVADARRRGNELRCWSAGCATGEEAYSLAVLLTEHLGDELEDFDIRVFATDVDGEAVAFARRGVYPRSALSAMPDGLLDRYFSSLDGAYEVKKRVRGLVVFGQHDLNQRAPFPRIDLLLCRNVLIYFTSELQRRVLQLFAFSLRAGGRLVLGKSESAGPLSDYFALEQPRLKVYRRQGDRVFLPLTRPSDDAQPAAPRGRPALAGMELELARAHRAQARGQNIAERAEQILQGLPVGVVLVDRNYDIENINAAARRLLSIHAVAVGQDFVHLAQRLPSDRLRGAINAALHGEPRSETYEVASLEAPPGDSLHLVLTTTPTATVPAGGRSDFILIVVQDVTELVRECRRLETESVARHEEVARLGALLTEAQSAARDLLGANQELAAMNAVLRAQNEELLVSNEESQAAAEEIETLNEEQQATNEELETLNEELQATVEELNTTNEDLEARTAELQETAAAREIERLRLTAILAGMADAVLVVDATGAIALTNPTYDRLFGSAPGELVDEQGHQLLPEATPRGRAARGEEFTMRFARRGTSGQLEHFEARGMPADDHGLRGVVVIHEIAGPSTGGEPG
jgi:two-component system CheB/CheR fusion protein